jgi:hypothetical protein
MIKSIKGLSREEIKKLIDSLNDGDILYIELPEEFQSKKDKIRIPVKPNEPSIDECCGTGCRPCVFDIYENKLERYEQDINTLIDTLSKEEKKGEIQQ